MSDSLWFHGLQHDRPPCPSPTPGACSNSCATSQWCHPAISSSLAPSPPALNLSQQQGLFLSQFFTSGGQNWSFSFSISPSSEYSVLITFRIANGNLLYVSGNSNRGSVPTWEWDVEGDGGNFKRERTYVDRKQQNSVKQLSSIKKKIYKWS